MLAVLVATCVALLLTACDLGTMGTTAPATATPSPSVPTSQAGSGIGGSLVRNASPSPAVAVAQAQAPGESASSTPSEPVVPTFTPAPPPTQMPTGTDAPTFTQAPLATPTAQPTGTAATFRYVFPVRPISATSYGAYHHDYPATDIFCPVGSQFVAPTGGVVDYVSTKDIWDPNVDDPATRGGLSIAIIGDDGLRYYGAHLSLIEPGIAPGVRVTAGQLMGKTGHTGDARFTDPHLHFGISPPTTPLDWKTRRGVLSPYKYLRAWAAGTQLRPVLK